MNLKDWFYKDEINGKVPIISLLKQKSETFLFNFYPSPPALPSHLFWFVNADLLFFLHDLLTVLLILQISLLGTLNGYLNANLGIALIIRNKHSYICHVK